MLFRLSKPLIDCGLSRPSQNVLMIFAFFILELLRYSTCGAGGPDRYVPFDVMTGIQGATGVFDSPAFKRLPNGEPVEIEVACWTRLSETVPVRQCDAGHNATKGGVTKTYEHFHMVERNGNPVNFPVWIFKGGAWVEWTKAKSETVWEAFFKRRYGVNNACMQGEADLSHNCHSFSTGRTDHWVNNIGPILSVEYKSPDNVDPSPQTHIETDIFALEAMSNGNFEHSICYDSHQTLPSGNIRLNTIEKFCESQLCYTVWSINSPLSPPGPGGNDWNHGVFWKMK